MWERRGARQLAAHERCEDEDHSRCLPSVVRAGVAAGMSIKSFAPDWVSFAPD